MPLRMVAMSDSRGWLILFSLWVSESVRIFAIAAFATLLIGLDAAPLAWVGVAAIMGIAMMANWVVGGARGDLVTLAIVQALVGLPVIYLAPAARVIGGDSGLDLDWPLALVGGDLSPDAVAGVLASLILAFVVWFRGAALLNSDEPESGQRMIFYTGAAALGVLLLTEKISGNDVDAGYLTIPFFTSALVGMAINHLSTAGDTKRGPAFWGRFMTMAVGGILVSAITLTTLAVVFDEATHAIGRWIGVLISWILIAIAVPFALVALAAVWLIRKIKPEGASGTEVGGDFGLPPDSDDVTGIADDGGASVFEAALDFLRFPIAIIIVVAILLVLYITFRRYLAKRRMQLGDERESVRGDADAGKDMADLLGRLLPDWMKRNREDEYVRRFPADEPGISEVFQLYFQYLKMATQRGMVLDSGHTPNEIRAAMSAALPGVPVDLMTERFNAACYGHEPTSPEVVTRLRNGLTS